MAKVTVGRLDSAKVVEVSDDTTIEEALSIGGYTPSTGEVVQDLDNNSYDLSDEIEDGSQYFLVKKNKNQ